MGEYAEMMLDGTCCQSCGAYIGDEVGYPRYCSDCAKEINEQNQWTEQELKVLLENKDKNPNEIRKILKTRSYNAIKYKLKKLIKLSTNEIQINNNDIIAEKVEIDSHFCTGKAPF